MIHATSILTGIRGEALTQQAFFLVATLPTRAVAAIVAALLVRAVQRAFFTGEVDAHKAISALSA